MMETTAQPNPNPAPQTGGVEVKLNMKRANLWMLAIYLLLVLCGSLLYCYVWEDFSAYNVGYFIGGFWRGNFLFTFLAATAANILAGYVFLYFYNGRQLQTVRYHSDWSGIGFYSTRPIPLKWYRLFLLLPATVLGALPLVHGFCTSNKIVYAFGILSLAVAVGDLMMYWKLRPFDDEDLYQAGGSSFAGTIIRRNYPK